MKNNKLAAAMLFLAGGIILFAVSQTNLTLKLANFCLGACAPMFIGAVVALFMHFRNGKAQPEA